MIALFFEVTPRPGNEDRYLEIAGSLRPELETSGGVSFLDRYRSLSRPGTMLSHQLWADEASLARWRANGRHHAAQVGGRGGVFADYRLRVGAIIGELGVDRQILRHEVGIAYNSADRKPERFVVVVRSTGQPFDTANGEGWRSVYTDANYAWVDAVPSRSAGEVLLARAASIGCVSAAQLCLVSRDYGMFDRNEAPQYFPSLKQA